MLESAMRFAAFVVYSRALSPAHLGTVASVSALTFLTTDITRFGIDASVISLGSKEFGRGESANGFALCNAGLWLHLGFGSALALLGALASPLLARTFFADPALAPVLTVVFAASVVHRMAEYSSSVLRTLQRFRFQALSHASGAAALLVGAFLLSAEGRLNVFSVLLLIVLWSPAVKLLVALVTTPRVLGDLRLPRSERMRQLLGFGRWVWASNMLESGVQQANVLLLQGLAGQTAAGYYHVASRYAGASALIFEPLRKYLLPKFSELDTREAIADLLYRTHRSLAWTLLLIPLAWIAADPLIPRLQGGTEWHAAVPVFQMLIVARVLFLLTKPMTFALFSLGQPRVQAQVHLAATVVFFACAWLLVPRYGAMGSAIALLVFGLTVLSSLTWCMRRPWALGGLRTWPRATR